MNMWRRYGLCVSSGIRRTAATGRRPRRLFLDMSRPLGPPPAEQAPGHEDQDKDEDDEAESVLVPERDVDGAERFREPQHEASQNGARDVSEAAEDGDDERLVRERAADLRVEVVDRVEERARGADERGAEPERDVGDALRVDPHQSGGTLVLGGGADHPPGVGLRQEEEERGAQDSRDAEGEEKRIAEGERDRLSAELEVPVDRLAGIGDRHRAVIRREEEQREIREDAAGADGPQD